MASRSTYCGVQWVLLMLPTRQMLESSSRLYHRRNFKGLPAALTSKALIQTPTQNRLLLLQINTI